MALGIFSITACGSNIDVMNNKQEVKKSEETIYTYTDMDSVMYSKGEYSVRDLPCEAGNELGTLTLNEEVIITGQCNETRWMRINYNDETVYIDIKHLKAKVKDEAQIEIATGEILENLKAFNAENSQYSSDILDSSDNTSEVNVLSATENVEEVNNSGEIKSSQTYIVNGIDIRSGDYNGDGINDNNGHTWYKGQTWTASNGVVLKIVDAYKVGPGQLNAYDCVFLDGTQNIEPTSDFMQAYNEYLGRLDKTSISPDGLPDVITVSSKQTTINDDDASYVAYKTAFDELWKQQNGSEWAKLAVADRDQDGILDKIYLLESASGSFGSMWTLEYDSDDNLWTLTLKSSVTALIWDSILNSMRMINPDADAIYNAIYQDCYHGYPGLELISSGTSNWVTIGNTQLRVTMSNGILYYDIK